MLVQKYTQDEAWIARRPATFPFQLLSGRDGRLLWSSGPLPLGFEAHGYTEVLWVYPRVIEPKSSPDLLVMHRNPFLAASPKPIMQGNRSFAQERLTRISGRTGRIVWDIPLKDQPSPQAIRSPGNTAQVR